MDQKNTIVKCKAHPDCLFNYHGVCDNYVINIGADGRCEGYIETEWIEQNKDDERGQRAKCNFFDDACDYEPFLTKAICNQCKYDTHGNLCSRKNVASNGIWTCWEKKE